MSGPKPHLHAVTPEEVARATLREQAYRRFLGYYRHNPESQRAMVGALRRLARGFSGGRLNERTFPWECLVDEELTRVIWESAERDHSRNTALRDASALRQMLRACQRVELMTRESYRKAITFETKNVGVVRKPAGRYLSEDDVAALVAQARFGAGHQNTRIRDAALVMVLASSGARVTEISHTELELVNLAERSIWLRDTKNGTPRSAWLHAAAIDYLDEWISVRGSTPGPLFVPLSRTGRPMPEHGALSSHQIWKIVKRRAAETGLGNVTTHDLRRFMISTLLTSTDIALVSTIAGHAKTATTAAYDRRPEQMQRDAIATLQLPPLGALRQHPDSSD